MENPTHPHADVRLVPLMPILKSKGVVVGLEFIHSASFETIKNFFSIVKLRGYFSLAWYMIRAFFFGLRHLRNTDLIFCEHIYCAVIGAFLSVIGRKPCVWDSHGNLIGACREMGDPKLYERVLGAIEQLIRNRIKVLVVPTQLDKQLYISQGFNANQVKVIPCGVDLSVVDRVKQDQFKIRKKLDIEQAVPVLIFIGKRTYLPNKEAAWWINDTLAPFIEKHFGRVKIIITGTGDTPKKLHESVSFVGFVPNIYEYIHAADICLVPVSLDNGISTKLLDFMACSKPSVILSTVAKGMPEIEDYKHVILAKDMNQFLDKTLEALNMEGNLLEQIGSNARTVIEKYYSWDNIERNWNALLYEIAN